MPPQRARLHPWSRQRLLVLVHRQTPMIYPSRICCKHLLPSSALLSLTPCLLRSVQQCYPSCSRTRLIRTLSAYATCSFFCLRCCCCCHCSCVHAYSSSSDPRSSLDIPPVHDRCICYEHMLRPPFRRPYIPDAPFTYILRGPPPSCREAANRTLYLAVFLFLPS